MKAIIEYTTTVTVYKLVDIEPKDIIGDSILLEEKDLYSRLTTDLKPHNIDFNDTLRSIRFKPLESH